jgi:hypothetical protein
MLSLRKWTILIHRWLGIVLSLLFVVWFVSGIAMIYAGGMPSLTREARLEHLPPLDLSKVKLSPSEAVEKAELGRAPGGVTLLNVTDRPAYRFSGREQVTVFADNGDVLEDVGEAEAMKIASRFMSLPGEKLHYAGLLTEPDQWTVGERRLLPVHKIMVDDLARTELYVSEASAEVGLQTTRGTRALAWVAAIPHWLYFTSLRSNGPLWTRVVVWSSGIGTVLALLGIVVGIIQFSRSRPHIPYAGWMRWHYITGAIFGVFTMTWVFSGLLSMEPFPAPDGPGTGAGLRQALTGGPLNLSGFSAMDAAAWNQALPGRSIKEIDFLRIQGEPYYVVRGVEAKPLLMTAASLRIRREPFPIESLMSRVQQTTPGVPIADSQVLSEYDSYYYARGFERPLPVLRVRFADADSTWIYIDPAMSQVVGRFTSRDRVERWLYHGLHSLDFPFWYYNRPLWDIGVIVLSLGGIATSGIGLFIGTKRVIRHIKRFVRTRTAAMAGTIKGG